MKQITWTRYRRCQDGGVSAGDTASLIQNNGISLTLDTYAVITMVIDGTSCQLQLNSDSPATNANTGGNPGGLNLGSSGNTFAEANVEYREAVCYSVAHSSADISTMVTHLAGVRDS